MKLAAAGSRAMACPLPWIVIVEPTGGKPVGSNPVVPPAAVMLTSPVSTTVSAPEPATHPPVAVSVSAAVMASCSRQALQNVMVPAQVWLAATDKVMAVASFRRRKLLADFRFSFMRRPFYRDGQGGSLIRTFASG